MPTLSTLGQTLYALQSRGLDRLDAQLLLLHALGRPPERGWLLAHDDDLLPEATASALQALTERRLAGEPLAYLVGQKAFYGLQLQVSPDVLVPRPDTETLVDWALAVLPAPRANTNTNTNTNTRAGTDIDIDANQQLDASINTAPTVLDLGTGSGAIALALKATRPDVQVWATDRSAPALAVARANARSLGLEVVFHAGSWLAALPAGAPRFDCIATNPPYIAAHDPHLAALRFEPAAALSSGPDGLDDIRQIVAQAPRHLQPGGWLLLEHGYDQAPAVRALLVQHGWQQVQSRCDLAGIERCSGGRRPLG